MPIAKEDKILIKNLFALKGRNDKQLVREFSSNIWNVDSVYKFLQKLRVTGRVNCLTCSGRRCSGHTADVTDLF